MRVQITARQCEVPEAVREKAEQLITKLGRFDDRLSHAELIFEEEKLTFAVEGVLTVDHGEPMVAKGEGQDFRRALDQLVDRLGRMLRRHHKRRTDHRAEPRSGVLGGD